MGEIFLAVLGIGLIAAACFALAASNGQPDEKWIYDYDEESMKRLMDTLAVWEEDKDVYAAGV